MYDLKLFKFSKLSPVPEAAFVNRDNNRYKKTPSLPFGVTIDIAAVCSRY